MNPAANGGAFFCLDAGQSTLCARQLVLAAGSPACPQCGASGRMLRIAAAWGHKTAPFRPVLAPLLMPEHWPLQGLQGIALNVRLCLLRGGSKLHPDPVDIRPLLITHRGLSGPAALAASCWWQQGDAIAIDFLPEQNMLQLLDAQGNGRLLVKNLLARHLPARIAERLCPAPLAGRKCAELGKKDRMALAHAVHHFEAQALGVAGFNAAEAAAGGVMRCDLLPWLESAVVPGLFFCGEIVDAAGIIGGYNIHWALASGHMAGQHLRP